MRRLLPSSLRGQVLLAVLLALAVAQGIGAGIAVLTRQQAVRAAQVGDALDRAAALTYVIERTPADLHANILRAAETPLTRLSVNMKPLVAANGPGLDGPRRRLASGLEGEGHPIRMTMTTTSGKVVKPSGRPGAPPPFDEVAGWENDPDWPPDGPPDGLPDESRQDWDRRDSGRQELGGQGSGGGPDGEGPDGRGPESRKTDSQKPDGQKPDSQRADGRKLGGRGPEGLLSDGEGADRDGPFAGDGDDDDPPPKGSHGPKPRRDQGPVAAGPPPLGQEDTASARAGDGPARHDPVPRRARPSGERLDREALKVSIGLTDGRWLNADIRFPTPERGLPVLSLISFALAALAIGLALWIALARLLGPLRGLAAAAEGLGRGEASQPLPARGPSEMRALTEAFNAMQQRLHRMVSDRTQMLAALGHDLRSPLTALRVQTEMVDDDETRAHLLTSLAEMQGMVEQTLTYARGVWTAEAMADVDAADLVADLADEAGVPVTLPGGAVMLRLRPATMRRALRNLIDNARRYGGPDVTLTLTPGADAVTIAIADRGPGIPADELARVFDPFVRLEASRSRETGGTGLGLSIARSIVQAHGGEVVLSNREGGGLLASVTLPRPRPE